MALPFWLSSVEAKSDPLLAAKAKSDLKKPLHRTPGALE
jgi:hypothetical protein